MTNYGGDDVNSLVVDIGSYQSKAGYAGEDAPRSILRSVVGVCGGLSNEMDVDKEAASSLENQMDYYFEPNLNVYSHIEAGMEIHPLITDTTIQNEEHFELFIKHLLEKEMLLDPSKYPLLLSVHDWYSNSQREKITALLFETLQLPAFYLARQSVLSSFSAGRSTATILDCGYEYCRAVPIYDGYILHRGMRKQEFAGKALSGRVLALLKRMDVPITPQYLIKSKKPGEMGGNPVCEYKSVPNASSSYHRFALEDVAHDFKENICQASEQFLDEKELVSRPGKPYEFPDGYSQQFGSERFLIPEMLFDPERRFVSDVETQELDNFEPIQNLLVNSVNLCDVELRPHLWNNIVITGGSTMFPGFVERLESELMRLVPGMRIRFHAPASTLERTTAGWIGGSILASLGNFHQLWISKEEYDETGASIVNKKCL